MEMAGDLYFTRPIVPGKIGIPSRFSPGFTLGGLVFQRLSFSGLGRLGPVFHPQTRNLGKSKAGELGQGLPELRIILLLIVSATRKQTDKELVV